MTTATKTPAAQLREQIRNWLADRRQHLAPSAAVNPGWFSLGYLLNDFTKHTPGYGHLPQRGFRRHVRAIGIPVLKVDRIWFAGVDTTRHARPRIATRRTAALPLHAPQPRHTRTADLFAVAG